MLSYLIIGALLLVWLVLSWLAGSWLPLKGTDLWVLRSLLALLGLIGAGFSIFWTSRRRAATTSEPTGGGTQDVDLLVHEAVRRLRGSNLGSAASLGKLPVLFFIGETGSVKTTTITQSGLDPELLAGHVYQENTVLPTKTLNVWYVRQAAFVDCGGELAGDSARWSRLIHLTQPGRLAGALGKKQQSPRVAIVCYPCENFFQPGASESAVGTAKKLNARLQEISRILGISFPIYVLFTKFDRIPFFSDYLQNMTKEEVAEVLGTTLPVRPSQAGVYAEEESSRLTKAFDELFYSIAEKRLDLLSRENQAERLSGIYEFPREMRKMRSLLVDFLVNLARPSQLQSNPFLRGFYFSGVRAVLVDDVAPAAREMAVAEAVGEVGATRMFSVAALRQPQAATPAYEARSRKVPQWVFLTHLFNDVILKDQVAFSTSGFSSRVNLLRRVALIAATVICLIFATGFLISFVENHVLETELADAARQVPSIQLGPGQLASVADLQRLERLRRSVAILSRYRSEGHPWRMGWFLYIGDRLYPQARQLYFDRFHQMMFGAAQSQILAWLQGVPDRPAPNLPYDVKTYNTLKAYLITTSYPEKSTQTFLSPVLLDYWRGGHEVDPQQADLAKQQFDFYASELAIQNPYSATAVNQAVIRTQSYLKNFAGIDRFYLPLLTEADGKTPAVTFNGLFKGSKEVVVNDTPVRRAFTTEGFTFVQTALNQPQRYFKAEEWVLGKGGTEQLDTAQLQQQVRQRYYEDFVKNWYNVLRATRFIGYASLNDADMKLKKVADPSSPLLELFWFVSHNTNVDAPDIKEAFEPVRDIVPPEATDKYVQPANKAYMQALSALSAEVTSLVANGGLANKDGVQKVTESAEKAAIEVGNVAQNFPVHEDPPVYQVVKPLLDAPITNVNNVLKFSSVAGLNKSGQDFCHDFSGLSQYYPFNSSATAPDLPLKKFSDMFAPATGAFWKFADGLKDYVPKTGTQYVSNDSGTVRINRDFVTFLNRTAALASLFYSEGASSPKLTFNLGQMQTDVDGLTIKIGSQTLEANEPLKTFTWTGNENDSVQVSAKGAPYGSSLGTWAIFRFISGATWHDAGPNVTNLERTMDSNGQIMRLPPPDNRVMFYRYQLQVNGINPFRPSEWNSLRCVPRVAH